MTPEEIGAHLLYIRASVDEIKKENLNQWHKINENSKDIAVLKDHDKHPVKWSALVTAAVLAVYEIARRLPKLL